MRTTAGVVRSLLNIIAIPMAIAALVVAARAQSNDSAKPAAPRLQFDVASVKPSTATAGFGFAAQPGGVFRATGVTARTMTRKAWALPDDQIVVGVDWFDKTRFDVLAKSELKGIGSSSDDPKHLAMLRELLAERFALRSHWETRTIDVFFLDFVNSERRVKNGIKPSTTDCEAYQAAVAVFRAAVEQGKQAPAPAVAHCGLQVRTQGGLATVRLGAYPLSRFVTYLARFVGRTVVDKTQLEGLYDIDFTVGTDSLPGLRELPPAPGATPEFSGRSLSTALSEDLGLKLSSGKAATKVLVIDSLSPPTPD